VTKAIKMALTVSMLYLCVVVLKQRT